MFTYTLQYYTRFTLNQLFAVMYIPLKLITILGLTNTHVHVTELRYQNKLLSTSFVLLLRHV